MKQKPWTIPIVTVPLIILDPVHELNPWLLLLHHLHNPNRALVVDHKLDRKHQALKLATIGRIRMSPTTTLPTPTCVYNLQIQWLNSRLLDHPLALPTLALECLNCHLCRSEPHLDQDLITDMDPDPDSDMDPWVA
jgi:hypothetical protein